MKNMVYAVFNNHNECMCICVYVDDARMLANNYYESYKAIPLEDIHEYI